MVGDAAEVRHHPGTRRAGYAFQADLVDQVGRNHRGAIGKVGHDGLVGGAARLRRRELVVLGQHATTQREAVRQAPVEIELAGVEVVVHGGLTHADGGEIPAGRVGRADAVVDHRRPLVAAVVVAVVVDVELVHHHRGLHRVVMIGRGGADLAVDREVVGEAVLAGQGELLEHRDQPAHGLQVGAQRLVGAGVLDLDGDLAAVGPHGLVHLPDAGRGHGFVTEGREPVAPPGAELGVEHAEHLGGGQRGSVLLQFGQRLPVGFAELLGDGGLHDRERLADLHGAALPFT